MSTATKQLIPHPAASSVEALRLYRYDTLESEGRIYGGQCDRTLRCIVRVKSLVVAFVLQWCEAVQAWQGVPIQEDSFCIAVDTSVALTAAQWDGVKHITIIVEKRETNQR